MLGLDALEHPDQAPELWAVLTTRTVTLDMAQFYRAREYVVRALQRRWGNARVACVLEYTTGYGERSGGERRPHWNLLIKGPALGELELVREKVASTWARNVDALAKRQHVGAVYELGGLAGYLAAHVHKADQKPPPGFRGQRFNCGRDYFEDATRAQMRERAQESIILRNLRWRYRRMMAVRALELGLAGVNDALELEDDSPASEHVEWWSSQPEAEAWVLAERDRMRQTDWRLVRIELESGSVMGVARKGNTFEQKSWAGYLSERELRLEGRLALENPDRDPDAEWVRFKRELDRAAGRAQKRAPVTERTTIKEGPA